VKARAVTVEARRRVSSVVLYAGWQCDMRRQGGEWSFGEEGEVTGRW
jgi:hypothetical protein